MWSFYLLKNPYTQITFAVDMSGATFPNEFAVNSPLYRYIQRVPIGFACIL